MYETLPAAYGAIFQHFRTLPGYLLVGLPAVEIYHTTRVNVRSCGRSSHIDEVIAKQSDLVRVLATLKQFLCVKGQGT